MNPTKQLFCISEKGLYGFIDRSGKDVIAPQFQQAHDFSEGLARVVLEHPEKKFSKGHGGYIDATGKLVIGPGPPPGIEFPDGCTMYSYGDFHQGRAKFWVGDATGRGGYIDTVGALAIGVQFQSAGEFSEGLACVSLPAEGEPFEVDAFFGPHPTGFIDRSGNFVIPPTRDFFGYGFSEGLCVISEHDGSGDSHDSVIDKRGETVIPTGIYSSISSFVGGLSRVVRDDKVGCINRRGEVVVPIEYDQLWEFGHNELTTAKIGEKYVILDRRARPVTAINLPDDAWTSPFSDGLACVTTDKSGGYIDERGKLVIPMDFDRAYSFRGGLALVEKDGTSGYIDHQGQFVWKTEQWERPVRYTLSEPLAKFLPPKTIAALPLDYEWQTHANVIVFVANDDVGSLHKWYTKQFRRDYKITKSSEPGRLDIGICSADGEVSADIVLMDTSFEEADGLVEYLASKNLKSLREKHQPRVVGYASLSE